jgi:hypothetical protein
VKPYSPLETTILAHLSRERRRNGVRHQIGIMTGITKSKVMEHEQINRSKVTEANDRTTFMTDLDKCLNFLEEEGYTDQFRVEHSKLASMADSKCTYEPKDVKAVNFYRFEGISNPDDMSILYAIETCDGRKGTLVDAYGLYSDDDTSDFMKQVDTHKQVARLWEK